MSGFKFIPEDWELSAELRDWSRSKGLTDRQIDDELEAFRDFEYRRVRHRPDACWRNWIRNGIRWGTITPCRQPNYRRPERVSDEQRRADILAFERDPLIRKARREDS